MDTVRERIVALRQVIERAALAAGRAGADVQLVAVTKTVEVPRIQEVLAAGIDILGESRVQEAEPKWQTLGARVRWHLVGHLQSNKVKKAVRMFDLIHSVDSPELARVIDREAGALNKVQEVLVQVNTSGESTKHGVAPEAAAPLARDIANLEHVRVRGLMTIGPLDGDQEQVRASFRLLRTLRDRIAALALPGVSLEHLSMGMSDDFEIAIAEGATLVRLGRAIFGERA
jgi:hypothetical protein